MGVFVEGRPTTVLHYYLSISCSAINDPQIPNKCIFMYVDNKFDANNISYKIVVEKREFASISITVKILNLDDTSLNIRRFPHVSKLEQKLLKDEISRRRIIFALFWKTFVWTYIALCCTSLFLGIEPLLQQSQTSGWLTI